MRLCPKYGLIITIIINVIYLIRLTENESHNGSSAISNLLVINYSFRLIRMETFAFGKL